MRKFKCVRVVIGYSLGVVASFRSSTVVTPAPSSCIAGFLYCAVGACPGRRQTVEGDIAETLEDQATLIRLFPIGSLVPVRGTCKGDSIVTFDLVIASCFFVANCRVRPCIVKYLLPGQLLFALLLV